MLPGRDSDVMCANHASELSRQARKPMPTDDLGLGTINGSISNIKVPLLL